MTDFKAKMRQIRFRLGFVPDPAGRGAYSAPSDPLLDLGAASRQGRRWAGEEEGKGREGEWREGKGGSQDSVEPGPLTALLRHWVSESCWANKMLHFLPCRLHIIHITYCPSETVLWFILFISTIHQQSKNPVQYRYFVTVWQYPGWYAVLQTWNLKKQQQSRY